MQSLAVYIHIPFCRQRCAYCHFDVKIFHPRTDPAPFTARYLDALYTEMNYYSSLYGDRPVGSVFFGGGTPSRLDPQTIAAILAESTRCFNLAGNCEISMEVNPEDASVTYLEQLRHAGINRLSFGVQSFDDRVLQAVNRAHNASKALSILHGAPSFPNGISLDLILGLPFQEPDSLRRDLDRVAEVNPDHLSLYMLERDLPTPLDKNRDFQPDEDQQADFYEMVCERLNAMGYDHYEISNFARDGKQCRHNLVYWRCGDYLGLGPAAHGRVGAEYRANYGNITAWQQAVAREGQGCEMHQIWSPERLRQERLVQGLRLAEGVPAELLTAAERESLEIYRKAGLITLDRRHLALTPRGRLLANEIFAVFVS